MEAKFLDLSNLSLQRRPFALSSDGRNVWTTVLFEVESCTWKSSTSLFFPLFLTCVQDHGLLISRTFATMVTWRNNLSPKNRDKREDWGRVRPCKATGLSVRTSTDEWFYLIFYRYTGWKINGFWSGHKVDNRTAFSNSCTLPWPGKTGDISQGYHGFARKMTSEKRAQKFHTDEASLPRSG